MSTAALVAVGRPHASDDIVGGRVLVGVAIGLGWQAEALDAAISQTHRQKWLRRVNDLREQVRRER